MSSKSCCGIPEQFICNCTEIVKLTAQIIHKDAALREIARCESIAGYNAGCSACEEKARTALAFNGSELMLKFKAIQRMLKWAKTVKDLPPEFKQVIDDNFWELL